MRVGLTGSKLFGGAGEGSDTDVYVQDHPATRAQLLAAGFIEIMHTGKCGPNVPKIFRKQDPILGSIDVGLCKSFERKHFENRVASITPIRLLMRHAPKRVRTAIWQRIQNL
jgi:hypothetical protein